MKTQQFASAAPGNPESRCRNVATRIGEAVGYNEYDVDGF